MPDSAVSLRLLRAAEAVARHGSVAAAADELHLSRSAVSRAVAQAESQLGAPLFERGARGMSCTPLEPWKKPLAASAWSSAWRNEPYSG